MMMEQSVDFRELSRLANEIRKLSIRATSLAGSGHPGGSLSCADLMSALYFHVLRIDPKQPDRPDRDRFVLSKGHACPALYAALALRGFFPVDEVLHLRELGAMLQGHPYAPKTPGIDASTGSLGHGLSVANGMALAARLDGRDYTVYALMGDGEIQEGQIWEAAMSAAHFGLDNVIAFVDNNHLQIDGFVEDVMNPGDIADKFRSFGWFAQHADGHSIPDLIEKINTAKQHRGAPCVIVMQTVKGKGVSFMENKAEWHGVATGGDQTEQALKELEGAAV